MKNHILAVACTVVCIVLLVFLIIGAVDYQHSLVFEKNGFDDFDRSVAKYESMIKDAEKRLILLEKQVNNVEKKATLTLAFCGMSDKLYTDAFPIMQQHGIVGTLVISGDRLPGGEGLLSDPQILEMVNAGWRLIPGWTEGDGDNGILSSSKWISDYGYDFEGTVFIDSGNLTSDIEDLFRSAGHSTVISDIGFGTTDNVSTAEAGDIWKITAMGYRSKGPKGIMNYAIETYGNLVFTVDFETEDSLFDGETLTSMLGYLKSCVDKGNLSVVTPSVAREYRTSMDSRIAAAVAGTSLAKEENERIISEAEAAISSLYEDYLAK